MSPNHRSKADRAVVATTGDDNNVAVLLFWLLVEVSVTSKEGDGVRRRDGRGASIPPPPLTLTLLSVKEEVVKAVASPPVVHQSS